MTLRMPLALTAATVLTLLLFGAFAARPVSAHTIVDAPAAVEAHDAGADQLTPDLNDTDQAWIWIGVGIFVIFAVFGLLFAVFGYLEATRRE